MHLLAFVGRQTCLEQRDIEGTRIKVKKLIGR